ncbi:hypothetical protein [Streptomyces sp. NRRL F-2799]|uniref:hypothetical protein n=1 Tax=Streptomyces sp. NRRL F-2799 TaxID=1463844 RepID=UPI0018FE4C11|nr:hypothetical protein [Streptomyces sp. NRRL F-2799]
MGLSLGEGEEGAPVLCGRWERQQLTTEQIGIERILLAVSPSGRRLLTVPVGLWTLSLHQLEQSSKDMRMGRMAEQWSCSRPGTIAS